MKPLAIDLYAGLGGWTEGLLAAGYEVVGFDMERHRYPRMTRRYSEELKMPAGNCGPQRWSDRQVKRLSGAGGNHVLDHMDILDGWVEYPAQLVLQDVLTLHGRQFKDAALIVASPPCQEYSYMAMPWSRAKAIAAEYRSGVRDVKKLTALFDACFRIQREACEAAGRHIPLVVENVRGAQKWVGRSRWNFGSFHLWGDVPALMPITLPRQVMKAGITHRNDGSTNFNGIKNSGRNMSGDPDARWGSHNISPSSDEFANLVGIKNPGFRFDGSGRSMQSESVDRRMGGASTAGGEKSNARKAASAMIARIPEVLARHIAQVYYPHE